MIDPGKSSAPPTRISSIREPDSQRKSRIAKAPSAGFEKYNRSTNLVLRDRDNLSAEWRVDRPFTLYAL